MVIAAIQQHLVATPYSAKPDSTQSEPCRPSRGRPLITEFEVLQARNGNRRIATAANAIITPLASESAQRYGVEIVLAGPNAACMAPAAAVTPSAVVVVSAASADVSRATVVSTQEVVALASDHGGFAMKQMLLKFLETEVGCRVLDLGTFTADPVDYPDFAHKVAGAVARGEARFGICIDGMGLGSAMAANRHAGVRAATCREVLEAVNAREHNDANVLCLGGRMLGELPAKALVSVFLATKFAGGRHAARVKKIEAPQC